MIEKIVFEDLKNNKGFQFLNDLNFFKKNKDICFTEGVNILFAPNGAGKSTLLKMMAQSLACEQGGISKVTNSWRLKVMSGSILSNEEKTIFDGIDIIHDGYPSLYVDSRKKTGLDERQDLDNDFAKEGFSELLGRRSDGFNTIHRTQKVFEWLDNFKKFPKEMEYSIPKNMMSEYLLNILDGKIKKTKPTILMDEPESGLSAIFQGNFFSNLSEQKNFGKFQWIIATHSPFALLLPNVNIINLVEDNDYLENTLNAYKLLFKHLDK